MVPLVPINVSTNGTIGCRETFRVFWLPMVPLGEFRTHAVFAKLALVILLTLRVFKVLPMVQWYTNIVQGSTNGTIGFTIGTNGNANGTIGSPNGTIGKPMVPLATKGTIGKITNGTIGRTLNRATVDVVDGLQYWLPTVTM